MILARKIDPTRSDFLGVIAILLAQNVKIPTRWAPRLFLCILLLPLFEIGSLYICIVQSYMVHPPISEPVLNVFDFIRANLTVHLSDVSHTFLNKNINNESTIALVISNETTSQRLERLMLNKKTLCVFGRSTEVEFYTGLKHYPIHTIDRTVATIKVTLVTGKASLYATMINDFLLRCIDSGLYHKWITDVTNFYAHSTRTLSAEKDALTLEEAGWLFMLLPLAYSIAFVVFLGENVVYLYQRRWGRKKLVQPDQRRCGKKSKRLPFAM